MGTVRGNYSRTYDVWGLKIPTKGSWEKERLLWIGYEKGNQNKCPFAELPKDVIRHICKFLSPSLKDYNNVRRNSM